MKYYLISILLFLSIGHVRSQEVVCDLTVSEILCQDFIEDALFEYPYEFNCDNSSACSFSIRVGDLGGTDVIIIREECFVAQEFSYQWHMYDCDGTLLEECSVGLTGNCNGSTLYDDVDDEEFIYDCLENEFPDNCDCVVSPFLCIDMVEVSMTTDMSSVSVYDVLDDEDSGCTFSFSESSEVEELFFDCDDIGSLDYEVFNPENEQSCFGTISIVEEGGCGGSVECPSDPDSIICQTWLSNIIVGSTCDFSDPQDNNYFKIYTVPFQGETSILFYQQQFVVSESSKQFTLYNCAGDPLYECSQGIVGDCNDINADPILGPIINDTILIYDCRVDQRDCPPNNQIPFITTWKTDNPGTSCSSCITIPTFPGETYSYDVDWDNDGVFDEFGISGDVTHDFGVVGTYTIAIKGIFPRIYFDSSGDTQKITNIDQWGDIEWSSMEHAFSGSFNMTSDAIDSPNLTRVTSLNSMFSAAFSFNGDIRHWDVRNVTDMSLMFFAASSFNQPIGNWNVGRVTSMASMFFGASSFNQPLNNWDVSSTTSMFAMFAGAELFNQDLGAWSLLSTTSLIGMLNSTGINCENYSSTLIGWAANPNTPVNLTLGAEGRQYGTNAISARSQLVSRGWTITGDSQGTCGTVVNCTNDPDEILCYNWLNPILTNTDICLDPGSSAIIYKVYTTQHNGSPAILVDDNINCINPTFFGAGFTLYDCDGSIIEDCTYQGFETCSNPPVDNPIIGPAFSIATLIYDSTIDILPNCNNERPFITIWKTDNPGSSCSSCITIPTFSGETYDYDIDWDNDGVYDTLGITGDFTYDFGTVGIYTIAIRGDFPRIFFNDSDFNDTNDDSDKIVDINQWGDIQWSSMADAFQGCRNMIASATDKPDISNLTDLSGMFDNATLFNEDISDWEVSHVTNMSGMFRFARAFNQDIGGWDVGNVTDMSGMFTGTNFFNQDISIWDVSNVTDMSSMFNFTDAFNQDIGGWDVGNVTNMRSMFWFSNAFNQDIGIWDVSNVTDMDQMFWTSNAFNQDIGDWEVSNVAGMLRMFDNAIAFNQSLSDWNLMSSVDLESMLDNSGIDCANYTETLQGWAANSNTPTGITLGAEGMQYDPSTVIAREALINNLDWTITGDMQGSCGITPCTHPDYDALLSFYNSTNGDSWTNNDGWLEGSQGSNCDPCTWFGIGCDTNGRVDSLRLFSNELNGILTSDLQNLTFLRHLNLGLNELTGEIPPEIGNLNNLTSLRLFANDLSGSIPPEIGNLTNLEFIWIANNNLNGEIPTEIGGLINLITFWAYENNLSGDIPSEFGNLNNLTRLRLESNNLDGCFPPSLQNICSLPPNTFSIIGDGYNFTDNPLLPYNGDYERVCNGDVQIGAPCGITQDNIIDANCNCVSIPVCTPANQGDFDALISIYTSMNGDGWNENQGWKDGFEGNDCDYCQWEGIICDANDRVTDVLLSNNNLTGSLPPLISNGLEELVELSMFTNNINGDIPSWIYQKINLERIDLNGNNISGIISPSIGNLSKLRDISLLDNELSGSIPANIGNLDSLEYLVIGLNNLEGGIPNSIVQCLELQLLAVFSNNISGQIPSDIGQLVKLEQLLLNDNNLTGIIPSSIGQLSNIVQLLLNDNNLSGCFEDELLNLCSLPHNENGDFSMAGYSFVRNTLLPFSGDYSRICIDDDPQIGAPCGMQQDSIIDANCNCVAINIQRPFITTWQTDNPGSSCPACITIPTTGGGYNYDIDWDNDGVYDTLGITGDFTYDFGTVGIYTIAIRGDFPRIFFNNEGDKEKIVNINQWGDIEWTSMVNAFFGCSNLNSDAIDVPDLSSVTSLNSMFNDAESFNGNIDNWDVSNVTDMLRLFDGAREFNGNLNSWQVGNVSNMSQMFKDALVFNGDLSNWNVESVTDMFSMFRNAISFNSDISNWNLSNANSTQRMFEDARSFDNDIGSWDVSNVLTMNNMFKNANSFNQELELWSFNPLVLLTGMLDNSGIDCDNYSSTLAGWAANPNTPDNLTLGAIGMQYDPSAASARDQLLVSGWMINGDIESSCMPCNHSDYDALLALYNSTNGVNWTNNTGWVDGAIGINCDPCTWEGVICDIDLRVIEISLSNNGLAGLIPDEFYNLDFLEELDLSENAISGELSVRLGNLSSLKTLRLGANNLIGSIPESFGNLVNLESIWIGNNELRGEIPQSFNQLSLLRHFDASKNSLTGTLDFLSSLTSLETVNLIVNEFSGSIPNDINNLSFVRELRLSDNNLTGSIPSVISDLSTLEWLDLSLNRLEGEIPVSIYLLQNLERLWLHENNLIGSIHPDIQNLSSIISIALYDNNLEGRIPSGLISISTLTHIDMSDNNFSGCFEFSSQEICNLGHLDRDIVVTPTGGTIFTSSYNFIRNNLLPYNGDYERVCAGEPQEGASCGIKQNEVIDAECECVTEIPCPGIDWINLPADITISCDQVSSIDFELPYSNMGDVDCIVMGTTLADTSIVNDGCDKILTLEWVQVNNNVEISTQQVIRITDIPAPSWVNPIDEIQIQCEDIPAIESQLEYSNGLSDICQIAGIVEAVVSIDTSLCGEDRVLTWNYQGGNCFVDLTHTQDVEVLGCNAITLADDFLSAMTRENIEVQLLENDVALLTEVNYSIEIINFSEDILVDTILTQDGLFSFRLNEGFLDTIKVVYEVCDLQCNICESATLFITDESFEDIVPTNYLSPNGDGKNDQLRFTDGDVINGAELWIFNRWGDQIYYKENYTNDWNANGIPSGVYYYVLRIRDTELKRTLTILK